MSAERGGLDGFFKDEGTPQKQQDLFGNKYFVMPLNQEETPQSEPVDRQTGNLFTGYIPPVQKSLYSNKK